MSPRKADGAEAIVRKADAALVEWFRHSRITTQQASVVFARFLDRAKRQGAGALRHQVDGLQVGLEKLSSGLQSIETERNPVERKRPARGGVTPKRTVSRKRNAA